jgi:hypothetical protein
MLQQPQTLKKEAVMRDFTITEDFPKSEIEFDQRFSEPKACYDYLFKQKWPNGFICKKCSNSKYWVIARNLYICTQCEHHHSLIAGTIIDSSKKTDHLLVQSHVVVHHAKIRHRCCKFKRTFRLWQLRHCLVLAAKA